MTGRKRGKAYIIGGGIAGLAAAVFLITDAGMKGSDIFMIDRSSESGGGFDGRGSAGEGYLSRGYRMFEKTIYLSTFDLLSRIPSPENPQKSLKDDFFAFNERLKADARARLMEGGRVIDASRMQLSWRDRWNLVRMLYYPEAYFGTRMISDFFSPQFFKSNFWHAWATTFAFEPWHSVVEMRRYLNRAVQSAPVFDSMSCVLSAPYCEHDFIIVPLVKMLKEKGVHLMHDRDVTDLDFAPFGGKKTVTAITFREGSHEKITVLPEDVVFVTNGSMMADTSVGLMDDPPSSAPMNAAKGSSAWGLWKNIARKSDKFGRPAVFCDNPKKSSWESFTVTFHDPAFFEAVEKVTSNKAGTGVLTTFKDSNWLMTFSLPHQPYFKDQPAGTFVCWGYGLFPDKTGNFVRKRMSDCSGKEILEELCGHLGLAGRAHEIIGSSVCIPCYMPYITAQFLPRKKEDRPEVVPKDSHNLAFIGQFVEIPREIVFTVECSVRSAKIAVKRLMAPRIKIPPIHSKKFSPKVLYGGIKKILR